MAYININSQVTQEHSLSGCGFTTDYQEADTSKTGSDEVREAHVNQCGGQKSKSQDQAGNMGGTPGKSKATTLNRI